MSQIQGDAPDQTQIFELSYGRLEITTGKIGEDILITVAGGEKPHIGCVAIAQPRFSLKDDGSQSVTSSVINLLGHKDEQICRHLAEKAAVRYGVTAVCTGGFHVNRITKKQIEELIEVVKRIEV
jgi:hypothetical protein